MTMVTEISVRRAKPQSRLLSLNLSKMLAELERVHKTKICKKTTQGRMGAATPPSQRTSKIEQPL